MNTLTSLPITVTPNAGENQQNYHVSLAPDLPWLERQEAARRMGSLGGSAAVNALVDALPHDPFWMVRCSIVLALQQIGDPAAIPVLEEVARSDSFQAVRSHARKAIEQLSG